MLSSLDFGQVNVNDASAKNVDAIIPEVPQIDTNENVNEASAQISDAIIEEKPQIYEISSHIEIPVNAIPWLSSQYPLLFLIGDIYLFAPFHRCRPDPRET
jgi:hypothetical protein